MDTILSWASIPQHYWRDFIDIFLVALVYQWAILLFRDTRTTAVFHGIILIILIKFLSGILGFHTLYWLTDNFMSSFFLMLIIIFQDDIRKALAKLGSGGFFSIKTKKKSDDGFIREFVHSLQSLSSDRIGALIVFENREHLGDIIERSVEIDAPFTSELFITIFYPNTPLHDGAVIMRGSKIAAAGCVLPVSSLLGLDSNMGIRHRAALGISEESDAVAVVVSEETGKIRMAKGGKISEPLGEWELREYLIHMENIKI